jgi:hypothetical protein
MNLNTSLANVEITDDGGTLNVNADATDSTIHANDGTVNLTVNQTLAGLDIGAEGVGRAGCGACARFPRGTRSSAPALLWSEIPYKAVRKTWHAQDSALAFWCAHGCRARPSRR